eukprot:5387674-Amphidinium_carterae.1
MRAGHTHQQLVQELDSVRNAAIMPDIGQAAPTGTGEATLEPTPPAIHEEPLHRAEPGTWHEVDWTSFDMGRALRALRSADKETRERVLRKLHLRWFHCPHSRMVSLLKHAGVSDQVLEQVRVVTDTCRVCRLWQRPSPRPLNRSRLADNFNQLVQCDLLFVLDYIIVHLIDECLRFSVAIPVKSRAPSDVLGAITRAWFKVFGPPAVLVSDREGAVASEEGAVWAERWNTSIKLKAHGSHAAIVERHNELLRQQIHRTLSQLQSERIVVPFEDVLSEAVLAKNVLLTVGGSSPYEGLFGRRIQLLPEFEEPGASMLQDTEGGIPGVSKQVNRLREVAVAQMIEATSKERLLRANRTRTRMSGEELALQPGDLVEIYRKPATKDLCGWRGPCEVVNTRNIDDGLVDVRWQGRTLAVRIPDLRRAIMFVFLTELHGAAMSELCACATNLHQNTLVLGWLCGVNGWFVSHNTSTHSMVYRAAVEASTTQLHMEHLICVRLGHGVSSARGLFGVNFSLLVFWPEGKPEAYCTYEVSPRVLLRFQVLFGDEWDHMCWLQFCYVRTVDGSMSDLTTVVMDDSIQDHMSQTDPSLSDAEMPEHLKR